MTAPTMDRRVACAPAPFKAIVGVGMRSALGAGRLMQEDVDQGVRHCVSVSADRVEIVFGKAEGVVADQFAATFDR
jgi:hypothetical protein